jgi:hypothetical protein
LIEILSKKVEVSNAALHLEDLIRSDSTSTGSSADWTGKHAAEHDMMSRLPFPLFQW